ncbi:MAG: DUF371 domain-containing protein [Candidatus Woesearchaeota archaeon]
MAQVSFNAFGHKNILATHKKTIEFTKDSELTKNGDCILGVSADFSPEAIQEFIKMVKSHMIEIEICGNGIRETIRAVLNKSFSSDREIVIRKSDYESERTLGVLADKAASQMSRDLVKYLKSPKSRILVTIREA